MCKNSIMKKTVLFVIVFSLFNSCITYSDKNRGSLSDAMDKARDDYPDKREIPESEGESGYYTPWDDDEYYDHDNSGFDSDLVLIPVDSYYSFNMGIALLSGPYFSDAVNLEVLIGNDDDHLGFYLYGALTILEENKNHDVSESIEYPYMFDGGVEFRLVPLGRREFFSPYLALRLGGILLSWEYQNMLGDDITEDTLGGFSLGAGIGINFINTDLFRLGLSCKPRVILNSNQTVEGFDNDYFDPNGDLLLSMDFGLKF